MVIKKLQDDYLRDTGIKSRFKREYEILKSLQDVDGVIKVYSFDEKNYSYTMEYIETTLKKYVDNNRLSKEKQTDYISKILETMAEVHKRGIIHRDISATNIFVSEDSIKIADFGLGKNLKEITSHHTLHTNNVGQYLYCAPEQYTMLKNADKRSDVFALGKIINFIMTSNTCNSHHIYRRISEKATNEASVDRYSDAEEMFLNFKQAVTYNKSSENKKRVNDKIQSFKFDNEIEDYLYELSPERISSTILMGKSGFTDALLTFMKIDDKHAMHIINTIHESYKDVCGWGFENYDPFAEFAYTVLNEQFSYVVNEIAAEILHYVAKIVNRYNAQDLVKDLIRSGVEPNIEAILDSE